MGIQCPHTADEYKFLLVDQHVSPYLGVYRKTRPDFISNTHHVLLILFGWFVKWEVSGRTTALL